MSAPNRVNTYAFEKEWHGLSCSCGGGYKVGHPQGCEYNGTETNLQQVDVDIARALENSDEIEVGDLRAIRAAIAGSGF